VIKSIQFITPGDIVALRRLSGKSIEQIADDLFVSLERARDYYYGVKCGTKTKKALYVYYSGVINGQKIVVQGKANKEAPV
jgi:hypothetical protein